MNRESLLNLKISKQRIDQVYNIRKDPKAILGRGNFGMVIKAEDKITGQMRAVKIIKKEKLEEMKTDMSLLSNEYRIMLEIDHPNIIRLYEVYEDIRYFYFVLEYMKGNTLYETLVDENYECNEAFIRDIFFQAMKAIQYLHKHGIAHRDLKPENIMFVSPKSNKIKIIDFGVSKYFFSKDNPTKEITLRTQTGSLFYISPESMEGAYDCLCDIWSAGVILYSLFAGSPPFFDMDPTVIVNKVRKIDYNFKQSVWQKVSPQVIELIKHMLVKREQRYTAEQVLQHEWLKMPLSVQGEAISLQALKQFFTSSTLAKYVLNLIAAFSAETENGALGSLFVSVDLDGDGLITREDLLVPVRTSLQFYKEELSKLILAQFKEGEKINYTSFVSLLNGMKNYSRFEQRVEKVFRMFDQTGKGRVEAKDLQEAMKRIKLNEGQGKKSYEEMIEEVDKDKKGYLTLDDFKRMMSCYMDSEVKYK